MNQELVFDPQTQAQKDLVWWLYLGHGLSLVLSLGMLGWVPLIINYVKRDDARGTFLYSHHSWQIRSFWWYLFWMFLGGALFLTFVGIPLAWLTWFCAPIWKAYRLIKGFLDLGADKPMPD
jgi:uncharacterized membrane protein